MYVIRLYNVIYHPIYFNILFLPHKSHLLQLLSEGIEAIKHTGHTHLVMDFQLGVGFGGHRKLAVQGISYNFLGLAAMLEVKENYTVLENSP